MNQLGFLPGERNWHWWERAQASYARLKGTLRRESSYGLGFHKLPNVSERSSSQRWNLTSCGYFWLNVSHTQVPHLSQGDPSHLTRPHCIFRRTKSRQEADLQSQGRSIRLARSPHLPSEAPSADSTSHSIIVLRKNNSAGAKQQQISSPTANKGICSLFHLAPEVTAGGQRHQLCETPNKQNSFHRRSDGSTKARSRFCCSCTLHLSPQWRANTSYHSQPLRQKQRHQIKEQP